MSEFQTFKNIYASRDKRHQFIRVDLMNHLFPIIFILIPHVRDIAGIFCPRREENDGDLFNWSWEDVCPGLSPLNPWDEFQSDSSRTPFRRASLSPSQGQEFTGQCCTQRRPGSRNVSCISQHDSLILFSLLLSPRQCRLLLILSSLCMCLCVHASVCAFL